VGTVFEDLDGDGKQDMFAGEMGLAGWTVQLSWNGQAIGETQTDADGKYVFFGLGRSNAYMVCLVVQAGYSASPNSGPACRGAPVDSPFETYAMNDYAMMLQ
jgi:hypothetical protein